MAGRSFELSSWDVEEAIRNVLPEPIRQHYVVVGGRRFPPKQVIALLTELDRSDFTTNQARGVLQRLGLTTARAGAHGRASPHAAAPRRINDSARAEAEELRPHRGRYVAVRDGRVLVSSPSPHAVLDWLEQHDEYADSMFRVPLDPSIDMGGFPG